MATRATELEYLTALFTEVLEKDTHDRGIAVSLSTRGLRLLVRAVSEPRLLPRALSDRVPRVVEALSRIESLSLAPGSAKAVERTSEIDLGLFTGLRSLQLTRCKPSLVRNLRALSRQLRAVKVTDSIAALSELLDVRWSESDSPQTLPVPLTSGSTLAEATATGGNEPRKIFESHVPGGDPEIEALRRDGVWGKLEALSVEGNFIAKIDSSAELLTSLTRLSLARNLVVRVSGLQACYRLAFLSLEDNNVESVEGIFEFLGNVKCLILRRNRLRSTRGLELLVGLEELDIGDNSIETVDELHRLKALPLLRGLWTDGNPMTKARGYRAAVCSVFRDSLERLEIDGKMPTEKERERALAAPPITMVSLCPAPVPPIALPSEVFPPTPGAASDAVAAVGDSAAAAAGAVSSASPPQTSFGSSPSMQPQTPRKKKKKKQVAVILDPDAEDGVGGENGRETKRDKAEAHKLGSRENSAEWKDKIDEIRSMAGDRWLIVMNELMPPEPMKLPALTAPPSPCNTQTKVVVHPDAATEDEPFPKFDVSAAAEEDSAVPIPEALPVQEALPQPEPLKVQAPEIEPLKMPVQAEASKQTIVDPQVTVDSPPVPQPKEVAVMSIVAPAPPQAPAPTQIEAIAASAPAPVEDHPTTSDPRRSNDIDVLEQERERDHEHDQEQECPVLVDSLNVELRENESVQAWLQTRVFSAGDDEFFLHALQCSSLRFGATSAFESERPGVAVLSTCRFYVVVTKRAVSSAAALLKGATIAFSVGLPDIRAVVIGPQHHWFRVETPSASLVVLTRTHEQTHWFVDALMQHIESAPLASGGTAAVAAAAAAQTSGSASGSGSGIYEAIPSPHSPCVAINTVRVTCRSFAVDVLRQKKDRTASYGTGQPCVVLLYSLVVEAVGSKHFPRTLVATREKLFLCTEDLTRWPVASGLANAVVQEPQTPRFKSEKDVEISDLASISLSADGKLLNVNAEAFASASSSKSKKQMNTSWSLGFATAQDRDWVVCGLERLYLSLMKVPLDIVTQVN